MQSTKLTQSHRTMSNETMHKTTRIIKYTKVVDTSTTMTTDVEDMEVEVDSLGIVTSNHIDPSNVSHATKKVIDM